LFESDFLTTTEDSKDAYRQLIAQAVQVVNESWRDHPYSGRTPAALAEFLDSDFLPAAPGPERIADLWRTIVNDSIAVSHPHTAAHLHCPPLLASLAAEVVISALNQSMDSFDQAPIATIVEQKLVRWLCAQAGLSATAAGTFTTGGSQSNYMGLLLARDAFIERHWHWSVQKAGLPPDARRLRILCSEVAHFTVEKSAPQLGLGTDAVVRIAVDDRFRMDPVALNRALDRLREHDLLPMAIVATAGTTDFGSVDRLSEVAAIARGAEAWFHVDAAYGGALLFSPNHREKLRGIEAADSLSIDFHKLFWQPIPCSVFLLRDARHFDAIKLHADYLNPEGHEGEGIPNLVTTSLLTSRRFDALKLWSSFQVLGSEKLASMISCTLALANHAADVIRSIPQLELTSAPQLSTVVFRYIPRQTETDADHLNAAIRQRLFDQGLAVIGHTRVRGRQCLKLTCMNPATTEAQMEALVKMIVRQGSQLEQMNAC
jgi:L-2,4-diaminobutyrate decarboxylase